MSDTSQHIDVETLNMLKEIMEDGFANLLQTYIDDSKIRVEELKQAVSVGDADSIRRTAHSLKGSSSNLGVTQMTSLCLNVEHKGKDEQLAGLEKEVELIEAEYNTVADIMRSML